MFPNVVYMLQDQEAHAAEVPAYVLLFMLLYL